MFKTQTILAGIRAGVQAKNPAYVLSDVVELREHYIVFLSDPKTKEKVPGIWTPADEEALDTEDKLVTFIYNFVTNLVDSLTDMIRYRRTGGIT